MFNRIKIPSDTKVKERGSVKILTLVNNMSDCIRISNFFLVFCIVMRYSNMYHCFFKNKYVAQYGKIPVCYGFRFEAKEKFADYK